MKSYLEIILQVGFIWAEIGCALYSV